MKRFAFLFLFIGVLFFIPNVIQAEECSCWCKSSAGAQSEGTVDGISTCQEKCDNFLGCYTEDQATNAPVYDTMCWTEYECETATEAGGVVGQWGGQAPECMASPAPEGYCYNTPEDVNLNVAIGSLTTASSMGEYINAAYSWALSAGSLLAVVMMMLGGVQYILARGKKESVGKAQKRIKNAFMGVILLFGTYTIAHFVDPSFTTFNRLSPPRMRTVVFVDESTSCEALMQLGMSVDQLEGSATCGAKGEITDLGNSQTTMTAEVGDECMFISCDNNAECMSISEENEDAINGYICVTCSQAANLGVNVSESVCSMIEVDDPDPDDNEHYFCEYDTQFLNECVELVYPEETETLNCDLLEELAKESGSLGCRAYDLVYVGTYDQEVIGTGVDYEPVDDVETSDGEAAFLERVCESDPCGFAPTGETCETFISDPDEVWFLSLAASVVFDELIVNCSNSSSSYGLRNCLGKDNIGEVKCKWSW